MHEYPTHEATAVAALGFTRSYPATPGYIRQARQFLSGVLAGFPAADDAVLCLSEIATNAVTHSQSRESGGHFTVRAQIHGGRLRVEVQDEGGIWTCPVRRGDGQHGRGLLIVAQLARDWGRSGDAAAGWTVWFEVDVLMAHNTENASPPSPPGYAGPAPSGGETVVTETSPAASAGLAQYSAQDMRSIEAALTARGLTTHVTDSRAGLDLTATPSPAGQREAEFWIDEAGYAELRYWNPPGTSPAEATATALRVLHAVTGTQPGAVGPGPQ